MSLFGHSQHGLSTPLFASASLRGQARTRARPSSALPVLAVLFVALAAPACSQSSANAGPGISNDGDATPNGGRPADNGGAGGGSDSGRDASRVVVFGDVHGDRSALESALRMANLVDDAGDWNGGMATLVQVGDVLDRGDDERAILDDLLTLKEQARIAGGEVIQLNGNHEMLNVEGDFQYVTDGSCAAFSDLTGLDLEQAPLDGLSTACKKRGAAFLPGGPYAIELAKFPVSYQSEDTLFVHAGVFPFHVEYGLDRVNDEVSAWMLGERASMPGPVRATSNSMVWTRTFGESPVPESGCDQIEQVLDALGLARMVIGHTVQTGINADCDGLIWRIDTGMSAHYGGSPEALEIRDGEVSILTE